MATATPQAPVATIPEAQIGPVEQRDLPEAPPLRRIIGPSVILVGVGIASGEYILFPYIASQVGLVFLWAGIVGLLTQYFINMEIERYTLATGETAVTGFQRLWKPFGLLMVACAILPNIWPAWATSAATITTFLFGGGNATAIAIGAMVLIGIALSASPVVYQTIEKFEFAKVALVLVFLVVALTTAVSAGAFGDVDQTVTSFGSFTGGELELAVLLGALAYAGAGGTNNLVVSNWIRDKGYGMGKYAPRVVSPITGTEEAAPSGRGYVFPITDRNLERWRDWWRKAEHRAVLLVLRDRRDHDRRLLARRVLDGVRQPGRQGQRLRLHPDRGQRAQGHGRHVVRHAVLGDRRDQPVRRRVRDHRLRQPPGRRRAARRLRARQPALDREPPVLRRRLDDDRVRVGDPAVGLRPAARRSSSSPRRPAAA